MLNTRSHSSRCNGWRDNSLLIQCVFSRPSAATKARRLSVILGKSALNETVPNSEQEFRVDEVFVHEDFDNSEGSYNNDIGRISSENTVS